MDRRGHHIPDGVRTAGVRTDGVRTAPTFIVMFQTGSGQTDRGASISRSRLSWEHEATCTVCVATRMVVVAACAY